MSKHLSLEDMEKLFTLARSLAVFFIVISVIELVLTIIVPVGPTCPPMYIYARNYSGVAAYFTLGYFLYRWGDMTKFQNKEKMNILKTLTFVTSAVCFIKAGITLLFFYFQVHELTLVGLYYIIEFAAWAALGCFFIYYFLRMCPNLQLPSLSNKHHHHHHHHHHSDK